MIDADDYTPEQYEAGVPADVDNVETIPDWSGKERVVGIEIAVSDFGNFDDIGGSEEIPWGPTNATVGADFPADEQSDPNWDFDDLPPVDTDYIRNLPDPVDDGEPDHDVPEESGIALSNEAVAIAKRPDPRYGTTKKHLPRKRIREIEDVDSKALDERIGSYWTVRDAPSDTLDWQLLYRIDTGVVDFSDVEDNRTYDMYRRVAIDAALSTIDFPRTVRTRVRRYAVDVDARPWGSYGGLQGFTLSCAIVDLYDDPSDVDDIWRERMDEFMGDRFGDFIDLDGFLEFSFDRLADEDG